MRIVESQQQVQTMLYQNVMVEVTTFPILSCALSLKMQPWLEISTLLLPEFIDDSFTDWIDIDLNKKQSDSQ